MRMAMMVVVFGAAVALAVDGEEPLAQGTFRVVDDSGKAMTGALVRVTTFSRWVPGREFGRDEYEKIEGNTDTNGVVVLALPSKTGKLTYQVVPAEETSDGVTMKVNGMTCYMSGSGVLRFAEQAGGKWQPLNSVVDIVIKRVLNPIPMYARSWDDGQLVIPAYNVPLGFDLMKSDWIPPYGHGETADFIFRLDCQLGEVTPDKVQYFDATFTLSFSNDGDGIQEVIVPVLDVSRFRLPRFAPESGYVSNLVQHAFEHRDASHYERNEKQNFIYRVRTKKNGGGQIVSALYGKVAGPFSFGVYVSNAKLKFRYYLNPTPNDRNLEFDPKRNLFTNLKPSEQVTSP